MLPELMTRWLGPNWRTSSSAIFTAFFFFVSCSPEFFGRWPVLIAFAKFATASGLVKLGIDAKDRKNQTG